MISSTSPSCTGRRRNSIKKKRLQDKQWNEANKEYTRFPVHDREAISSVLVRTKLHVYQTTVARPKLFQNF